MEEFEQSSQFSHEFVDREWKNSEKESDIEKRVYLVGRSLVNAVWKNDKEKLQNLVDDGKLTVENYTDTYDLVKICWEKFKQSIPCMKEAEFWNCPNRSILDSMNQTKIVKANIEGTNIEWAFDFQTTVTDRNPSYPTLVKLLIGMTAIYECAWQTAYCRMHLGRPYVPLAERVANN